MDETAEREVDTTNGDWRGLIAARVVADAIHEQGLLFIDTLNRHAVQIGEGFAPDCFVGCCGHLNAEERICPASTMAF